MDKQKSSSSKSTSSQDIRKFGNKTNNAKNSKDTSISKEGDQGGDQELRDDEEVLNEIKKRLNFVENNIHKWIFDKFFVYEGHEQSSEKFYATCRLCKDTGKCRKYYFDQHNFKSNASRHITVSKSFDYKNRKYYFNNYYN